jgi:hypothetical protein
MCCILRLMVLLDKGTFESSFPPDSPIIMFTTISTAAGRMSSSAIVWASYILRFYVLPSKMLAKHCLLLMPAYRDYPFVDLTLLASSDIY